MRHLSFAILSTLSTFTKASTSPTTINKTSFFIRSHGVTRAVGSKAWNGVNGALFTIPRGGGEEAATSVDTIRQMSTKTEYVKLSDPAPGSPFHLALPVHDLDIAKDFYGNTMGCAEGRSSAKWQDYSLHGHQIVCHWVGNDYRCQDYFNPVDGDEVPVPHFGLALTVEEFHGLADRLKKAGIKFIIEPHLRFKGQPGEQWTMFFKDPSGNNLEFKAMTNIDNLFAKYNVVD